MISVCIATYNGARYILPQLKSILSQLGLDDEVIISDDRSTDDTINLIDSLMDRRIKVIKGDFRNPIYNFENALKHASGNYIFLSDQDDIWLENKIEVMIAELNSDATLVVSDCKIVDEKLETIYESYFEFNKSKPGFLVNLFHNGFMGCCMGFRKNLLDICLPFPKNLPMHDSYLGLVATLRFKVKFLSTPLILHRKHSFNASTTSSGKSRYNLYQRVIFRLNLLKAVSRVFFVKTHP
jgi:glycosyltransferase involved in cell wall biosynthesis